MHLCVHYLGNAALLGISRGQNRLNSVKMFHFEGFDFLISRYDSNSHYYMYLENRSHCAPIAVFSVLQVALALLIQETINYSPFALTEDWPRSNR